MLKNASIKEMKDINKKAGYYFFDKNSMRFFRSIVVTGSNQFGLFITSEKYNNDPRKYTIRFINSEGNVYTLGKFQAYYNLYYAKKDLKKITDKLKELEKCYLEGEILKNITAIYDSNDYVGCIEVYRNKKAFIFSLGEYEVKGFTEMEWFNGF